MPDTPNIVQFPLPDEEEEHTRRVMAEVERLSNLSPAEWKFQCTRRAEVFGIEPDTLKELVEAKVEERERKERKAQVAERDRSKLQRLADRNRQREDASKQKAEKKAELEKRKADRGVSIFEVWCLDICVKLRLVPERRTNKNGQLAGGLWPRS